MVCREILANREHLEDGRDSDESHAGAPQLAAPPAVVTAGSSGSSGERGANQVDDASSSSRGLLAGLPEELEREFSITQWVRQCVAPSEMRVARRLVAKQKLLDALDTIRKRFQRTDL